MIPSTNCVALVQQFEGCAKERDDGTYEAYPDPGTGAEPWTIGWGQTGPDVNEGTVWNREQCDDRLWHTLVDLAEDHTGEMEVVPPPGATEPDEVTHGHAVHRVTVSSLIGDAPTTQGQFDALVSFAYNVGLENLRESTLLRLHREGDHAGAAAQFARWDKADGKVLKGLTKRRAAEAALYGGTEG